MLPKPFARAGAVSEAAQQALRDFGARCGLPVAGSHFSDLLRQAREAHFLPKSVILRAGEPCGRVYLVVSGVARQCCTYGGQYHTVGFSQPLSLLADPVSFLSRVPAQLDLVAVTPLHVLSLTHEQVLALYAAHPVWEQCGRRVAEAHVRHLARRALSLQVKPAAARYAELMATRAHLFNQVPHHQLASYLGMAKETLSRLRRAGLASQSRSLSAVSGPSGGARRA